ncbi:MAG: electron transfer flavoprotein subunit alpha [Flavobacteriales bacterium]|nr:electron transfer flavoprotein subunit alpha [Flavobacteriales bacterium]|tara:strand:+ start:7464 stop:8213 length:750 start_codon:yes stop_codon:yes gene_type:complete
MNILVCISSVPDTTSKINLINDNKEFDRNGITFIINPYDEFCLTKAIFIKESTNAKVTVVNVGGSNNDAILRKALAIGADNAVRINKEALNGNLVASCIANYCQEENFDLIFCGRESIDFNGGKVPGFLAQKLNIPFVNSCVGMDIHDNTIEVKEEVDNGQIISKVKYPAVIAGQKGLVEEKDLKIPSMRGIMTARTKPLEVIESSVECNNNIKVINYEKPSERTECKIVDSEKVNDLVELLSTEAKVI